MNFINHTEKHKQSGFTLIELAITTIIVGILFAAIAAPFSLWLKKERFLETDRNLESMALQVSAYRSENGFLPCPAPLGAPRDGTVAGQQYGMASDCSTSVTAVGSCSGGLCRVARAPALTGTVLRSDVTVDTDNDGIGDSTFTPTVRIGAIPFRTLGIPEELSYDAYGNRIVYAVTEERAFNNAHNVYGTGAIVVEYDDASGVRQRHQANDTADQDSEDAEFIVLSHGSDKVGGYSLQGVPYSSTCDTTTKDGENCDHLIVGGLDTVFFSDEKSDAGGTDQHDDVAYYQMPLNSPLWARSSTNKHNVYSIRSDDTDGRVGSDYFFDWHDSEAKKLIVDATTQATYDETYINSKLWVGGNLLVQEDPAIAGTGQAQANEICNRDGSECFEPKIIGGDGVDCPNSIMDGFQGGGADCAGPTLDITCDNGQFLRGFNNGVKDCAYLPCAASTETVCSSSHNLSAAAHGTRTGRLYGGASECYSGVFLCNNGNWELQSTSGMCGCTASRETYTTSCPSNCDAGVITRERGTSCGHRSCSNFNRRISGSCNNCTSTCTAACGCPGKPDCKCVGCECDGTCPPKECTKSCGCPPGNGDSSKPCPTCNADCGCPDGFGSKSRACPDGTKNTCQSTPGGPYGPCP